MPHYVLGISAFFHDSAVALIKDGEILVAVQEERFSRIKHDSSFPIKSIQFTLNSQNLNLSDISQVVFYDKPLLKFERILETYLDVTPKGLKSFIIAMPIWLKEKLFLKRFIIKTLKQFITFHHMRY